jgi:molybdopterin synthase catalytic subunit
MEQKIELIDSPLMIDPQFQFLQAEEAGGICLFIGTIRNKNQGKKVNSLTMEAYSPMAVKQMEKLITAAGEKWPIIKVAVCHRIGPLEIGDIAVIIGVTCVHRAEAFEACQWLIDTLKKEVPIWKNEYYTDGSSWLVPHP